MDNFRATYDNIYFLEMWTKLYPEAVYDFKGFFSIEENAKKYFWKRRDEIYVSYALTEVPVNHLSDEDLEYIKLHDIN